MKKYQKNLAALFIILGLFLSLTVLLSLSFVFLMHGDPITGFMNIFIEYHVQLMIVLGLLGALLGVVAYKGFSDQQREAKSSKEFSKKVLRKFLDKNERVVVDFLLKENNGVVTQAHISRLKEMGKVRAFRTIQRLVEKEIITVTEYGSSKRIDLAEDIRNSLKE